MTEVEDIRFTDEEGSMLDMYKEKLEKILNEPKDNDKCPLRLAVLRNVVNNFLDFNAMLFSKYQVDSKEYSIIISERRFEKIDPGCKK